MIDDLPGHGTVETAAAPYAPTWPEDEWLARDLPELDESRQVTPSTRMRVHARAAEAPTSPTVDV